MIMADQLAATMVGFGGSLVGSTPNLDALAARSMVFDRAYVAHPICMPSRSSIITGRYPSSHGARVNGIALRPDSNTFVRALRSAGYRTGLIGKSHIQDHGDGAGFVASMRPDQIDGDALIDDREWDHVEKRHRRVDQEADTGDYYGFEHLELTIGHGDEVGGHHAAWARNHGADLEGLGGQDNALEYEPDCSASPIPMHMWRTNLPEELHATTFVAERSAAFIHDASQETDPFFVQCSFPDPHHPFTPPGSWFDFYGAADFDLPDTFDDTHSASMPHLRQIVERRGEVAGPYGAFAPNGEQWRGMAARAHGALRQLDEAVGMILDQLDSDGLTDDTVVVFCADHGEMFGDHGLMLKSAMQYDNVVRVPLTIAVPGSSAGRSSSLVSLVDIAPTLLEAAGAAGYWGLQGTSLMPVLSDPATAVRDAVLIEEDLDLYGRPMGLSRLRTIVTENGRLTVSEGGGGELFDFTADPGEMENRYDSADDSSMLDDMRSGLLDLMVSTADRSPFPAQFA